MDNNLSLKKPLWVSTQAPAINLIRNMVALSGKALPCHVTAVQGAMITVAFDVQSTYTLPTVTIPLFGPEYIRYPIQVKDKGYVIPVDCPFGYTSGYVENTPDMSATANLEALFFMPVGSTKWTAVDPNQVDIYAPNGVKIHDTASGAVINLHPSNITVTVGGTSVKIDGSTITATATTQITLKAPQIMLDGQLTQGTSGNNSATLQGPLTVVNDVTAAGKSVAHHTHTDPQGGNTSQPN